MTSHPAGTGPHVLRRLNSAAVLQALRDGGPARVADLVAATGLSRPAVSRAISSLRQQGWVADADARAAAPDPQIGRPAARVRFRAEAGHVLGIDVGPHKILAVVADLAGTVVASRRGDTHSLPGGRDVMAALLDLTGEVLADAGVGPGGLQGAAIGTPGLVDAAGATVVLAPSISGWASIPVAERLGHRLDCPLTLHNDVNLAVLGERWRGTTADAETLVFLQWGARVGAGILINGKLHGGAHEAAGEVGFLDLDDEPTANGPTGPNTMGPFERQIGAAAIIELASVEAVRRGDADLQARMRRAAASDDAAEVFHAAAEGNALAAQIIDRIGARLARGLAAVCQVLDPDLIVVGGGLSRAGATLLEVIERHLRTRTLVTPRVVLSSLGDTAVALGAVRTALDDVERRLFADATLPS